MDSAKAFSSKRLQIDKANATMVMALSISSFIFIFSLFAVKSLWSQRGYQQRVIAKKEKARDQLNKNVEASKQLVTQYQGFVAQSPNIIGGNPSGQGPKDGDNGKIILDALPSKYDFPAMAISMKNLFSTNGIIITGFTSADEELTQASNAATVNPVSVEMPFTATVEGSYTSIKGLINALERSIKPITIDSISIAGTDKKLDVTFTAKTYYQPAKSLNVNTEVVK